MIKHYIKIATRNLAKQKGLALINILGLSIGLACFTLFLLYAVNEFNFDRFHAKAENIYRVYRYEAPMSEEDESYDSYMPMPLGPALKADLADVEDYVRVEEGYSDYFIKANDQVSRMPMAFADPQIFSVFSFELESGDRAPALKDPRSVVLTSSTAKKLFGKTNPIG